MANRSEIRITKVAHLKGHSGAVYHFSVDRGEGLIYSVGSDGTVVRWSPDSNDGQLLAKGDEAWYCSAFHSEKRELYAGSRTGRLWKLQLDDMQGSGEQRHQGAIFFIRCTSAGVLTGGQDGMLRLGERAVELSNHPLRCIREFEGGWFIGDSGGVIHQVDSDLNSVHQWQAHDRAVFALEMMNSELVSTGMDAKIRLWDTKSYQPLQEVAAHANQGKGLHFQGGLLLSGSMDKSVRIWDEDLNLLKHLDLPKGGHSNCVNHVRWLSEDLFVSSSDDRTIIVWQIEYNL